MISEQGARRAVVQAFANRPEAARCPPLTASRVPGGWVLRGEKTELFVDAVTKDVAGHAPADPRAARAILLLHLLFATFGGFSGAMLFGGALAVLGLALRAATDTQTLSPVVTTPLALVLTVWVAGRFAQWTRSLKPALLNREVETIVRGVVRWPDTSQAGELLRRAALLLIPGVVVSALSGEAEQLSGQSGLAAVSWLVLLLTVGAIVVIRRRVPAVPDSPSLGVFAGGAWGELVGTALVGIRFVLIALLVCIGLYTTGFHAGLVRLTELRVPLFSEVLDTALQLAAIAAVLFVKPSRGRTAAGMALLAGLVGERLAGEPGKLLVSSITLFLVLRTARQSTTADAFRKTADFELRVALGRIAGRLIAAFFVGPVAIVLGEAIGEQLVALSTSARLEPVEVGARRRLTAPP